MIVRTHGTSNARHGRGMRSPTAGALFCAALSVLLAGCATNSVTTLLKASKQTDPVVPSVSVVQQEFKGRAFDVGTVTFDVRRLEDRQEPGIPDSAFVELFESQLKKAFYLAGLGNGATPAHAVNVAIEELKLQPALLLIPTASSLRVRVQIVDADGTVLMRGELLSVCPPPTVMVFAPGIVAPIPVPAKDWEYTALAKMFPAVAVVIATATQSLQQGKTFDEIRVYPDAMMAGSVINPAWFLDKDPLKMTQMDYSEMYRVIRAARSRGCN